MAKATKQLGGAAKDKYFRELFAAAPGLAPVMAKRLAELTKTEVSQVRIRQPLIDRAKHFGAAPAADALPATPAAGPAKVATSTQSVPPAVAPAAVRSVDVTSVQVEPKAAATALFDPFAFTAVVVLKRQGAAALEQRLAEIAEPAHLRLLADKQHLGVPSDAMDVVSLRAAILKAAQVRIDDRRAAAS